MINQLTKPYNYSLAEIICIKQANNNWGSQKNCIKFLKEALNSHFDRNQRERCCYCGLLYDRTGRGEIDHIAPQSNHSNFTYTSKNLAKACQLCNSSSMKHNYDTIEAPSSSDYEKCVFKIVHPYLDDHKKHYNWNYGKKKILISVKNNSPKAIESIRIFELASEKRTIARAMERNQEKLENENGITDIIRNRIMSVLRFR